MKLNLLFSLLLATLSDLIPVVKAWVDELINPQRKKLQTILEVLAVIDSEILDGKFAEKTMYEKAYRIATDIVDEDGVDPLFISEVADSAVKLFRAKIMDRKAK